MSLQGPQMAYIISVNNRKGYVLTLDHVGAPEKTQI